MRDLQPSSINNDTDNTVLIRGTKFDNSTSFFIQSTKLEIKNQTETQATVIIPKGFIPSKYGIMAANNTGKRATLYPAITIKAGTPARDLDIRENYQSFIDGYVFDYQSKAPIKNARISLPGLETTSSDTGYFLLRGVPAGRQVIKIEKQGYGYNPETQQYGQIDTHEPLYRIANVPNNPNSTITLKLVMLEPKVNNTTIIGPSGGIHYASSNHSTGAFLKIPAGALSKDTPIQFTHLRDGTTLPELNDNGNYLAFAHLGPTGLVFKKPATLFLPLQNGIVLNIGETINIGYFDSIRGEWIDDITSGKISKINGQLYLEYEINHFTWIGGFNPLPPVPFTGPTGGCTMPAPPPPIYFDPKNPPEPPTCDKKPESDDRKPGCPPRAGIPTDQGISDENGNVTGSKPGSRATQTIVITPLGYGDNVIPARSDPIQPNDSTPQRLPCARIPSPNEPYKAAPTPLGDNPCGTTPAVRPFSSPSPQGARPQATTTNLLLVSSNLHGFTTSLGNFSGAKINPSSIKLKMGSTDVTSITEIKPSSSIYDGFDFTVTLKEPLKAQVGLEVRLEGKTLDGKVIDSRVGVDVVAGFNYGDIALFEVDDADWIADIPSPLIIEGDHLQVFYKKSQKNQALHTSLSVKSLNAQGDKVAVTTSLKFKFMGGFYDGSTSFIDGENQVPITFIPSQVTENQKFDIVSTGITNAASGRLQLQQVGGICSIARQPEIYRPLPQFPPLIPTILGGFGRFVKFAGAVAARTFASVASLVFLSSDTAGIVDPEKVLNPENFENMGRIAGQSDGGNETVEIEVSIDSNDDGVIDETDSDAAAKKLIDNLLGLGGMVVDSSNAPRVDVRIRMPDGTIVQVRYAKTGTNSGVTSVDITYPTPIDSTKSINGRAFPISKLTLKLKPKK
jgi:hypothetical protein